jgi:tripartite-type tricarboxylate transporter receptor subunit TctC
MMNSRRVLTAFLLLAGAWCAASAPAWTEDFYKGKRINLLVGYAPGGSYDATARLLARHIGRHIPGNPDLIVNNMPGAGTLTSLQYLELTAPKDGTAIDAFDYAQIGNSRLTPDKVTVDFRKFGWLGSISEDLGTCYVWHTLGITTMDALKRHGQIHMGTTNAGTSSDIEQRIFKNIFKIDLRSVAGYGGSGEERLAIERGELEGGCGSWSSVPPAWIADAKVTALIRMSPATAPDLPASVPYAGDIAPSDRDRAIIRLLTESGDLGKPFVVSAAVPAERVAILRQAFDATMKDPAFLADAATQRLPISPKTADEAMRIINEIYAAPDDIVAASRKIAGD